MIRIKDIADRAGVSPTTVSNVIHGKTGRVSKATVEKINRILKEMEYVPSISARMLANNQHHIVAVFPDLILQISEHCRHKGILKGRCISFLHETKRHTNKTGRVSKATVEKITGF